VLERFLNAGMDEAKKALKVARKANGYAEAHLKGHRTLPKNSPGSYPILRAVARRRRNQRRNSGRAFFFIRGVW